MRKLLAFVICILMLLALVSCGDDPCSHRDADDNSLCDKCGESYTDGKDLPDEHTHSYTVKNTDSKYLDKAADCENAATYFYSCSCGAKGTTTFTNGSAIGHRYTVQSTNSKYLASSADCENAAKYYYSCSCGAKGATTFTSGVANGHSYTVKNTDSKYLDKAADCENAATYFYSCACGAKGTTTFTSGSENGHSYTVESTDIKYRKSSATTESPAIYWKSCACGKASTTETFTYGSALDMPVNSISLDKSVANIEVGDTVTLNVVFDPENATDKNVTWISSDSSIALVNNGVVVGVKVGTTTIIAMTANGKTATCLVNVSPKTYYAESVTLNKTSVDLPIGHTDTLTATVLPDYTTDKSVTWVSSEPSIVKVENGVITALSAGTATVTATTSNGKTASCTVTALFIPVTNIIINESLIYVDAGDSITVNATAVPENATLTNLVWSSSNTNIATVSGGVINGVSDGIAVITVKTSDGKIEKSFNVVVENSAGILYTKSGSGYAVSGLAQATETVIIPDTYKGKLVVSLSSGIFDSSAYVIKKLYIGKNVTNIPLGCFRNCTALEELSIHNINCANFGDLFGSLSIQWAGTVDDFIFLDFESKWNSTFGFEYQVPTSSSRWGINRSSAWYNVNGVYVYAPSSIIPHGDVVSWQTVYINPSNVNVDSYKVPKAVNLKAYYIPKTLTKIYLTGTNSSEGYPPEIDWIDSFATVLSTCKDKAQNAKVNIAGTEVTLPISSIISLSDVEKLKAPGTYEITVYYGGYITTVKVTVTECTGTAAVQENYKDSTCTKTGSYDSVTYCYSCNKELSRIAKTVALKEHTPKTAVEENRVEATCTEDGHYDSVVYCNRCDEELSRTNKTITKLGHSPKTAVEENRVEATCTEGHYDSVVYCNRCDEELSRQTITIPASHTPKSAVEENRVEATCTEGHYDSVVYCNRCDDELSRQTVIIPAAHKYINGTCTECGKIVYTRDGDYIYFGEYPQTIKADSVTITSTQDSRGYYLGSDGCYYAKVVTDPRYSGYTFSTGASVTDGTTYYFKVEPIRWRILSEDGDTALILCDSIIANRRYDDSSKNYKESEIRQWLNATFYETAFTELQKELILTTTVDNSVYSTGYNSNPCACENTNDKIFLLSYREVTNSAYGFSSDSDRTMQTSDYSRASGVYMSKSSSYYGNGSWWLRSPFPDNINNARRVDYDGFLGCNSYVNHSDYGVVPALQIRL